MARVNSNLRTILNAVVERIRATVPIFEDESGCFIGMYDGNYGANRPYCVVSPDAGDMDEGMWDGGGREQTVITTNVLCTVYNVINRDSHGQDVVRITDEQEGILVLWEAVLQSLNNHDLLNADGDFILRNGIFPRNFSARPFSKDQTRVGMTQAFKVVFDLMPTE